MSKLSFGCISATPFDSTGAVDEAILGAYFQRFVEADIGLLLGSGGTSESHCLTDQELGLLYRTAVSACGGRVAVEASVPEQISAVATLRHVGIASRAGVDVINIYPAEGRHGLRLTEQELRTYYETILHSSAKAFGLSISPTVSNIPRVEFVADICNAFTNVAQVLLMRVPEVYLMHLKKLLRRDVRIVVEFETGAINSLALGADGVFSSEANILPRTSREFLDAYASAHIEEMGRAYADLKRFRAYVRQWGSPSARWIKMCMRALDLPGAQGGARLPLQLPDQAEMRRFRGELLDLNIQELSAQHTR